MMVTNIGCNASNPKFIKGGFWQNEKEPVKIMQSVVDLEEFKSDLIASWKTSQGEYFKEVESDWTKMLDEQFAEYDKDFFKCCDLLIGFLPGDSGSVRYRLDDVEYNGDNVVVKLTKMVPFIVTMDYVSWNLLLPIEKSTATTGTLVINREAMERQ